MCTTDLLFTFIKSRQSLLDLIIGYHGILCWVCVPPGLDGQWHVQVRITGVLSFLSAGPFSHNVSRTCTLFLRSLIRIHFMIGESSFQFNDLSLPANKFCFCWHLSWPSLFEDSNMDIFRNLFHLQKTSRCLERSRALLWKFEHYFPRPYCWPQSSRAKSLAGIWRPDPEGQRQRRQGGMSLSLSVLWRAFILTIHVPCGDFC